MPKTAIWISVGTALLGAAPAVADPGHIAGVAGHDHWIALGAIGLAAALGAWAALKGKKAKTEDNAPDVEGAEA